MPRKPSRILEPIEKPIKRTIQVDKVKQLRAEAKELRSINTATRKEIAALKKEIRPLEVEKGKKERLIAKNVKRINRIAELLAK